MKIFNKKTQNTFLILLTLLACTSFGSQAQARQGWGLGVQVLGNFFLTDSQPDLDPGVGVGLQLDYRFNQRWALEGNFFLSFHDGDEGFEADSGIFMGIPTVELKFYLRGQESNIDPYLMAGLGLYVLTEGDIENNTGGVGLGGNFGVGSDFYVTNQLSLGIALKFRPTALIRGENQSSGLINLGLLGNVVWHF